ncbi:hypothetical protein CEXT_153591 [Caerostris extrusa]|uniref:Uncharacterized protein n=1 Tax=Caerostris extrusa TaxID=172846 RepID=A0AAV4RUH7_CAEEX|nr:hypothetical protein CEXT_153591 [Caerostris extrusa]
MKLADLLHDMAHKGEECSLPKELDPAAFIPEPACDSEEITTLAAKALLLRFGGFSGGNVLASSCIHIKALNGEA